MRVEVENRHDIEGTSTWRVLAPEFDRCAQRAVAAGAEGVLRYVGAGATAIVFVDQVGMAYKVARHDDGGGMRQSLRDESEWLDSAASTAIADHVVRMFDYDPARDVIVRDAPSGTANGAACSVAADEAVPCMLAPSPGTGGPP